MTDKAKTINIINHPLEVPKLHGHMKLELTGTREKLVVEHDNNMTDALEKLLDNKGIWCDTHDLLNSMCPTIEKALGGILLTDKTIPDGNLFVPAGTEVTACASYNIANNDDALTMGSYNQQESALDVLNKKMTYVYDWTTNQGNGTVAAACLTHANAGYAGYGDANISNLNGNGKSIFYTGRGINTPVQPVYINDEYMYTADLNNGMITIKKLRNCFKSVEPISVMFGQPNYMDYKTMQTWEFLCDGLNNTYTMCNDGTSVYLSNRTNVSPGGTLQIHKFTFTNTEVIHDVLNISNTSTRIFTNNDGMVVANGYLYVKENMGAHLIEINLENNSDTNEYSINTINTISLVGTWNINGKLFMTSASEGASACVFDTVTKTMKFTRCSMGNGSLWLTGNTWSKIRRNNIYYNTSSVLVKICNYLATINNLDKPVTKTADKTMKVTYTIQG